MCQICTLNSSVSEIRKRQEIGRGVRLVVDQSGLRQPNPEVNVLTVVANESYEAYVEGYQKELAEDFGSDTPTPRIANARQRQKITKQPLVFASEHFEFLWRKLRPKTRFDIHIDIEPLLDRIVNALDCAEVSPVRVHVSKARLITDSDGGFDSQLISGDRVVGASDSKASVTAVLDKAIEALSHDSMPIRLTRRTVLQILQRSSSKSLALSNPHAWSSALATLLRQLLAPSLVEGTSYWTDGTSFELSQFEDEMWTWGDRVAPSRLALYDHSICDSEVERRFIHRLESDSRTLVYFKFPSWYQVGTPVGGYVVSVW